MLPMFFVILHKVTVYLQTLCPATLLKLLNTKDAKNPSRVNYLRVYIYILKLEKEKKKKKTLKVYEYQGILLYTYLRMMYLSKQVGMNMNIFFTRYRLIYSTNCTYSLDLSNLSNFTLNNLTQNTLTLLLLLLHQALKIRDSPRPYPLITSL